MTRKVQLLVGVLALAAIAGAVTTAARAAETDEAAATSHMAGFDPFTLETYIVRNGSTSPSTEGTVALASRRPIRIPFRPALRSPFRPDWGF